MKKILSILCITFSIIAYAQSSVVSLTTYDVYEDYVEKIYIKDIDGLFNPYIGTWKWTNGNDALTITFQKITMKYLVVGKYKYFKDDLVAKYKYTQGNTVIVNTLNNLEPTILIMGKKPKGNKARFLFKDILKNKRGDIKTELLTGLGTAQLKFKLQNTEGGKLVFPGEPDFDWTFSIPHNVEFILTKQ